jgi:hypothetical protein
LDFRVGKALKVGCVELFQDLKELWNGIKIWRKGRVHAAVYSWKIIIFKQAGQHNWPILGRKQTVNTINNKFQVAKVCSHPGSSRFSHVFKWRFWMLYTIQSRHNLVWPCVVFSIKE